jgi:hypothetical protein
MRWLALPLGKGRLCPGNPMEPQFWPSAACHMRTGIATLALGSLPWPHNG